MNIFSFFKPSEQVKSLKAVEFKTVVADKNAQLVDVRTSEEYRGGTIGNAMLIDVSSPDFAVLATKKLDKSRPVAVFCRSGMRSAQAARMLVQMGFEEIYNLKGGIITWK